MITRSRDHVLTGVMTLFLRILQLLIALTVLGLAAYGLSFLVFSGISLNMFTAAATVIATVYLICASTFLVIAYNYWAVLFLDIFGFVFWLTSFALLTSQVRPFYASYYYDYAGCDFYYYGRCYYKRDLDIASAGIEKRDTTNIHTYRNAMAAAAALAGLEWLIFCVTLLTTIAYTYKHGEAGRHAVYGRAATAPVRGEAKADVEMQPGARGVQQPAVAHEQPSAGTQAHAPPPPPPVTPTLAPDPAKDYPPQHVPN